MNQTDHQCPNCLKLEEIIKNLEAQIQHQNEERLKLARSH